MAERRSRMTRKSTGRRLAITERDLSIFGVLSAYRYLRSPYLHAFAGGDSQTRFKERLGDLFHEGFIDRPSQQWAWADARCAPAIYEISRKGRDALAERANAAPIPRTFHGAAKPQQFFHAVLTNEIVASIELATHGRPDIDFIAWPEIVAKAPEATRTARMPLELRATPQEAVIPDAFFGLRYRTGERATYRFFAVEADRGTMPVCRKDAVQTSLARKLACYNEIAARGVHRTQLGVPNLLVLLVTTSQSRAEETRALCAREKWAGHILCKAIGTDGLKQPAPSLLDEPWGRGSDAPLRIGTPA